MTGPMDPMELPPKVRESFDRIMTQLKGESMPVIVCPSCGGSCTPEVRDLRQCWVCGGCGLRLNVKDAWFSPDGEAETDEGMRD